MNLPNRITIARILLVPLFMIFLLINDLFGTISGTVLTWNELIAALIFVIAATTDGIDGYIARKHNLVTNLGKLMDPLADKLLVSAALISLVEMDRLPAWMVIVIISREFAVSGLRMVAAAEGTVLSAGPWGKLKTVLQIIAIVSLMLNNFPFHAVEFPFSSLAIWAALIMTVFSGVDYFIRNRHVFQSIEDKK